MPTILEDTDHESRIAIICYMTDFEIRPRRCDVCWGALIADRDLLQFIWCVEVKPKFQWKFTAKCHPILRCYQCCFRKYFGQNLLQKSWNFQMQEFKGAVSISHAIVLVYVSTSLHAPQRICCWHWQTLLQNQPVLLADWSAMWRPCPRHLAVSAFASGGPGFVPWSPTALATLALSAWNRKPPRNGTNALHSQPFLSHCKDSS